MQINKKIIHIMTRLDLVISNQSLLKMMKENSISPKEVEYIDMLIEYKKMRTKQHKVIYIVSYLAKKYNKTERSVYSIVKKMSMRVKM